MIKFLEMGISPNEKNSYGVCALDLIYKNPQLSAAYMKWRSKGDTTIIDKNGPQLTNR